MNSKKTDKRKRTSTTEVMHVVIPYVEGVSARVDRVLKKYGLAAAMRPHIILRRLLVTTYSWKNRVD